MVLKKLFALPIAVLPVIVTLAADYYETDCLVVIAMILLAPAAWGIITLSH